MLRQCSNMKQQRESKQAVWNVVGSSIINFMKQIYCNIHSTFQFIIFVFFFLKQKKFALHPASSSLVWKVCLLQQWIDVSLNFQLLLLLLDWRCYGVAISSEIGNCNLISHGVESALVEAENNFLIIDQHITLRVTQIYSPIMSSCGVSMLSRIVYLRRFA